LLNNHCLRTTLNMKSYNLPIISRAEAGFLLNVM
jgi:hypothetical protein